MPDDTPSDDQPNDGSDRAGGDRAVLADLAAERKQRKAAERQLTEVQSRLEQLEASGKTETQRLIDEARKEAADEARTDERSKWTSRTLQAEVRAAAGGRLTDPSDAIRLIDLDDFSVGDDGQVDAKAITKAIDQLVDSKPYLAAQQSPAPKKPGADGGPRPDVPRDPGVGKDRLLAAFAEQT